MVPTAVGTMSNRCLVGFISVGLVRNVEGVDRSQVKITEITRLSNAVKDHRIFTVETIVESEKRLRV